METVRIRTKPFYQKAYEEKEYKETDNIHPTLVILFFASFALNVFFYGIHSWNSLKLFFWILYSQYTILWALKAIPFAYL